MAIPQAAPAADPSAAPPDPTAGIAAPDAGAASGGFVIELHVKADGSMSIGVEPEAAEAAEAPGAPGADPSMGDGGGASPDEDTQPVPNLAAAFKLIKEIVTHGGQMAEAGAGQDQMAGGYAGTGM